MIYTSLSFNHLYHCFLNHALLSRRAADGYFAAEALVEEALASLRALGFRARHQRRCPGHTRACLPHLHVCEEATLIAYSSSFGVEI